MIRPTYKKLDRFGVQGRIGFDPTKSNANIPLFDAVQKLIAGKHGLAGAGGPVANRIVTENMFQQSNVFNTPNDRDAVTERLERQFTEQLKTLVGNQAQAAGMQIPEFLQSQGIHGVQQFGSGDGIRYSAFSNDDFIHTSFNPLTGSNERALKAMMTKSGAKPVISGGTNERRTMEVYLREAEFKAAQKMTNMKAKKLNIGTSNKGDLEAIYATQRQRSEIKSKHSRNKNDVALSLMEDENSPIREEVRSKILKQEREKQIFTEEKTKLKEEGLIDEEPKKNSKSVLSVAGTGALAVMKSVFNVLGTIQNLTKSMVSYLNSIASTLGQMLALQAPLGIGDAKATQLRNWGEQHKDYNMGDKNILFKAAGDFLTSTGDYPSLDKVDFTQAGFQGYSEIINKAVEGAGTQQPLETMKNVYNSLYERLKGLSGSARERELGIQMKVLRAFGGSAAVGYAGMASWAKQNYDGKEYKYTKNNMFDASLEGVKTDGKPIAGFGYTVSGGPEGSDEARNTLDEVTGVTEQIREAFMRFILANMGDIKSILLEIARGILMVASKLSGNSNRSELALKRLDAYSKQEGAEGHNLSVNNQGRIRKAMRQIVGDETLDALFDPRMDEKAVAARIASMKGLKDWQKRKLLIGTMAYRHVGRQQTEYLRQPKGERFFTGNDGDAYSALQRSTGDSNYYLDLYGLGGDVNMADYNGLYKYQLTAEERAREAEKATRGVRQEQTNKAAQISSRAKAYGIRDGYQQKLDAKWNEFVQKYKNENPGQEPYYNDRRGRGMNFHFQEYIKKNWNPDEVKKKVDEELDRSGKGTFLNFNKFQNLASNLGAANFAGTKLTDSVSKAVDITNNINVTVNHKPVHTSTKLLSEDAQQVSFLNNAQTKLSV